MNTPGRKPKILKTINKPESLRQEVYERIKEAILSNQFTPGQKLDETKIGQMLGVSRTPVREALSRLAQENLAISEPNRGVFVARITRENLPEILELREVLEGLAVRVFTNRGEQKLFDQLQEIMAPFTLENVEQQIDDYNMANVRFHNTIIMGSQRKRLITSLEELYDHLAFAKSLRLISIANRPGKSLVEHFDLIAAITSRDSVRSEALMRSHIASLRADVLANFNLIEN
jgi:DNA-binding GntR family transcriptional regulator